MKKLILVTFGFMAWAFYVMSGGSDFDPNSVKEERLAAWTAEREAKGLPLPEPTATPQSQSEPTTVVVAGAPKVSVDPAPAATVEPVEDVTRVSLNLATLDRVVDQAQTEAAPSEARFETNDIAKPQSASLVTSSSDTPAIIPSLIAPNDGQEQAATTQTLIPGFDLRRVSANRVNVRGGPGTSFDVVGKLSRGDEIQVIEDNGAGWVRFETADGLTTGWLADFLLAAE